MQESVAGTQVVSRVAALLRLLAVDQEGVPTARLAADAGLTRPTAHRLLGSLSREGLTFVDARGGWHLGPEMAVLGSAATQSFPLDDLIRPGLRRLADATGESAFLSLRRGDETACLLREEGSFPVRSFVLHEGSRFPLGVGSAGIAILAFLPEAEREALISDDGARTRRLGDGHSAAAVRELLDETRRAGYAVNPGRILEGAWGMAAAVFDDRDRPVAALSITGIEPRFRKDRREWMGRLLLDEARVLRGRIR